MFTYFDRCKYKIEHNLKGCIWVHEIKSVIIVSFALWNVTINDICLLFLFTTTMRLPHMGLVWNTQMLLKLLSSTCITKIKPTSVNDHTENRCWAIKEKKLQVWRPQMHQISWFIKYVHTNGAYMIILGKYNKCWTSCYFWLPSFYLSQAAPPPCHCNWLTVATNKIKKDAPSVMLALNQCGPCATPTTVASIPFTMTPGILNYVTAGAASSETESKAKRVE